MELPGQIFVKTMNGKTITLNDVESTDTILDIKKKFLNKEKINDDSGNFIFMFPAGVVRTDDKKMDEIGVKKESTLYVVYKLGPPKEKKFPEKGLTGNLSNDTVNDLIMRVINTDDDPRSVIVIPGSVIGSERSLIEQMVTPCSKYYNKESEVTILWNDPDLGINWEEENPIVSKKDQNGLSLKDVINKKYI